MLDFALIAAEPWIDYNGVSKIELGANKEDVISSLGEPVLILASSEYDNTMYLFYNYHIKSYNKTKGSLDDEVRNINKERSTLIKFTFVDDSLVSWEEDKMTLSMSTAKNGKRNSSFLSYFSLLLNLVLLIKII
jgi:outer membrane protein assembly factor BamE (lipoprotein component of BamABCDE complex)